MDGRIFLTVMCAVYAVVQGNTDVQKLIYWSKLNIQQWHKTYPSRYLESERVTLESAGQAVMSMASSLSGDLGHLLAFPYRELNTAKILMAGTAGEGCVNGISNFLDKAIQDELDSYHDCTADATSKFNRLLVSWNRLNSSYQAAYQKSLAGIDTCAKTYPNKESMDRLHSCVETMNYNYFIAANSTQISVIPSPSMSYFQRNVVACASAAAKDIASKGWQFLRMLINCASLSGTVDSTAYKEELEMWPEYNDTLMKQITLSQELTNNKTLFVENDIINFYHNKLNMLQRKLLNIRDFDFYFNILNSYLKDYYSILNSTALDNPGEYACVATAEYSLDTVVNKSTASFLDCYLNTMTSITALTESATETFDSINAALLLMGNGALLTCFSQGQVFAPNTILQCYEVYLQDSILSLIENQGTVSKYASTLEDYFNRFLNNSELCHDSSLSRVYLAANTVMYDLQRCIYKSSGDTYEINTPTVTTENAYTGTISKSTTTNYATLSTSKDVSTYSTTTSPMGSTITKSTQYEITVTTETPLSTAESKTTEEPKYPTTVVTDTTTWTTTTKYPTRESITTEYPKTTTFETLASSTTSQYPTTGRTEPTITTTTTEFPKTTTSEILSSTRTTDYPITDTIEPRTTTTTKYPTKLTSETFTSTTTREYKTTTTAEPTTLTVTTGSASSTLTPLLISTTEEHFKSTTTIPTSKSSRRTTKHHGHKLTTAGAKPPIYYMVR